MGLSLHSIMRHCDGRHPLMSAQSRLALRLGGNRIRLHRLQHLLDDFKLISCLVQLRHRSFDNVYCAVFPIVLFVQLKRGRFRVQFAFDCREPLDQRRRYDMRVVAVISWASISRAASANVDNDLSSFHRLNFDRVPSSVTSCFTGFRFSVAVMLRSCTVSSSSSMASS